MQASRSNLFNLLACGIVVFAFGDVCSGQESRYQNAFLSQKNQQVDKSTPAMKFFGNRLPTRNRSQSVKQTLPAPQPIQTAGSKPFQTLQRGATLSPYLALDARTSDLSIPNYYAFVRPQQQQQLANKAQAAHIRRLKEQLRMSTSQGIVSNNPSGGVPTTGHSSQFLNMGGYYSTPR